MEIVLGRVGHYFDAGNGSCRTAIITEAFAPLEADGTTAVNVAGWYHDGPPFSRTSVPVDPTPSSEASANSFHLTRDCPWAR